MTARGRINTSGITTKNRPCRHCGVMFQPGNIANHERVCITPYTIERLIEMAGLNDPDPNACWEWPTPPATTRTFPRYGAISKQPVHRIALEMSLAERFSRV